MEQPAASQNTVTENSEQNDSMNSPFQLETHVDGQNDVEKPE